MGDSPSDIMFVHDGTLSFSTAIHIPELFGILLAIPPPYQVCVCKIVKTHPCPLQQPQIPIQHPLVQLESGHPIPHHPLQANRIVRLASFLLTVVVVKLVWYPWTVATSKELKTPLLKSSPVEV